MGFNARIDLSALSEAVTQIKAEIGKIIVGQEQMVELLVISLLANGHSLIEGVPGVAKTVTAKLLAKSLNVDFNRIQFTPDLMPSDILGTSIFNVKDQEFEFKAGPIFSNIVLIDEIKVKSTSSQLYNFLYAIVFQANRRVTTRSEGEGVLRKLIEVIISGVAAYARFFFRIKLLIAATKI